VNRINPYARGWLPFLVEHGLATEREAREAQHRIAQAAAEAVKQRYERRKRKRRRDS
jgi:hypothetical protein